MHWACPITTFLPLTVEVDDLKKISNSLSVLLSEKQKQEKVSDCMLAFIKLIKFLFSRGCYSPNTYSMSNHKKVNSGKSL